MINTPLVCPNCKNNLQEITHLNFDKCLHCNKSFQKSNKWLDLCLTSNPINQYTEMAYKLYSKFYAPFALLAYTIIWRGNIFKHIQFFRNILNKNTDIVDLATGDGSLTSIALFGSQKRKASSILAIDISTDMLEKAKKKFYKKPVTLVRGDVCQLPFHDKSINALSCFGGLNSFPSAEEALVEMARCLKSDGIIRGSVLLLPEKKWKKNTVLNWIKKGYQTEEVDTDKFQRWINVAKLKISTFEKYGDVLLFELVHAC